MNTTTTSNPMFVPTETFSHKLDELLQLVREMSAETISPQLSPPPSPPTATTSVINNDVFTSDLAAMKQDLERRLQRLEEMFPSTPRTSSPPSPTSSIPIAPTPPSSTTPSTPTPSAPTSIDTTTLIPTATREPLHPPPARCSTLGRSRDERALAPVLSSTSPLQASALVEAPVVAAAEEEVFTTTPAKCSTYCLSSKFRYFTISIPTHQIEVRLPCLASKVYDAQTIFERATDQYPVLLWSTFNGYWDFLLGKGPWPPPQLRFSFGLSSSGNWIDAQQRPPWPPPILSEFMGSNGLVECSKASCVFDRGKSGEGSEYTLSITFNGAKLQMHVVFFLQAKSVNLQVEMVHCNNLINASIHLTNTMVCGSVSQPLGKLLFGVIIQVDMQSAEGQLRPPLWPQFNFHTLLCGSIRQSRVKFLSDDFATHIIFVLGPPHLFYGNYWLADSIKNMSISWSFFWECATATYWQNPVSPMCGNSMTAPVSPWKHLHSHCIGVVHCQLIIEDNLSAIECWKAPLIAVLIKVIASKWVSQNMQQTMARLCCLWYFINDRRQLLLPVPLQCSLILKLGQTYSLLPQVAEFFVQPVTSVHLLSTGCHSDVVAKRSLPKILQHLCDYDDELVSARLRNHQELFVMDSLRWHLISFNRNNDELLFGYLTWQAQRIKLLSDVERAIQIIAGLSILFSWCAAVQENFMASCLFSSVGQLVGNVTQLVKLRWLHSPKCKSASAEPAYILFLPLFDGLTAEYVWPSNLNTALCASQCVLLVWLSTEQLSGTHLDEMMTPGWSGQNAELTTYLSSFQMSASVIQMRFQTIVLILRQNGWGYHSKGRANIACFRCSCEHLQTLPMVPISQIPSSFSPYITDSFARCLLCTQLLEMTEGMPSVFVKNFTSDSEMQQASYYSDMILQLKPPWQSPVPQFCRWNFTDLVLNKHSSVQKLLGHVLAMQFSLEHMRTVRALQKKHCWALTASLVGLLMIKPDQKEVAMVKQQLISWDPGGNHGFLSGNTTAGAASDINLHTTFVKPMHIIWCLYLLLYRTVQKKHHFPCPNALISDDLQLLQVHLGRTQPIQATRHESADILSALQSDSWSLKLKFYNLVIDNP